MVSRSKIHVMVSRSKRRRLQKKAAREKSKISEAVENGSSTLNDGISGGSEVFKSVDWHIASEIGEVAMPVTLLENASSLGYISAFQEAEVQTVDDEGMKKKMKMKMATFDSSLSLVHRYSL